LFNIGQFQKKVLGAYWLLLEPAPTCALFAGLLENDSPASAKPEHIAVHY
jgi:ABC-type polysaccharide/polyol phosphate export permease